MEAWLIDSIVCCGLKNHILPKKYERINITFFKNQIFADGRCRYLEYITARTVDRSHIAHGMEESVGFLYPSMLMRYRDTVRYPRRNQVWQMIVLKQCHHITAFALRDFVRKNLCQLPLPYKTIDKSDTATNRIFGRCLVIDIRL
jgi:hypothetical protein